jgi:phosphoribosylamine--glycine ligase
MTLPVVIKADGLVKGFEVTVTVASSLAEADGAIDDLCESRQGSEFLVEEFIKGHELSYTVLTDGASIEVLESSRDYKRLMDRDQGPNTGGMGAYSPPRLLDGKLSSAVMASIVQPALAGMAAEGNVFRGFLYVGVIVDSLGNPHALEFNCRLGDPEAQTILMRLDSDLAVVLDACTRSALSTHSLKWKPEACVAVCAVTPEYPAEKRARRVPVMPAAGDVDCKVFHGSTRLGEDGLFATGGRAFCVVAIGSSIDKAKARAYRALEGDSFGELKFRTDIGDEPAHFAALPSWPPQTNT